MCAHNGYQTAIALAEEKLGNLDPAAVTKRTGAVWDGHTYRIPWFGELYDISDGKETERILWLHYLISEGTGQPFLPEPNAEHNHWISYREIPGAKFYEPKFIERAVRPLVKRFGHEPEALVSAGVKLTGKRVKAGDYAVTLYPFPMIPVTYIIWAGSGRFASKNVKNIEEISNVESITTKQPVSLTDATNKINTIIRPVSGEDTDDDLPPDGNILFDRTAVGWLNAEDMAVLAALGTYKLIKM